MYAMFSYYSSIVCIQFTRSCIILCILTYSSTMHCILLSSSWGTTARSSNTKRVLQAGSSSVRSITVCIIRVFYKKYNIMILASTTSVHV